MRNKFSIYSRYSTFIKPITKIPIIRTYGTTIFTLLITAIFIIFAIKPTVETIVVLQKKLADSKQVLGKVNQKAKDLSQAKENYEKLDLKIKSKMSQAITDVAQLKSVTQTLEQLALKKDASISALQIQPLTLESKVENTIGTISEIAFTFNATGKYENLISFLRDLKTSDRLISIDSLSLSNVSEGEGLIMSLSGKAYYLK